MPRKLLPLLFILLSFFQLRAEDRPVAAIRPIPECQEFNTQKSLSKKELRRQVRAWKRKIRTLKKQQNGNAPPPCDTLITTSGAQLLIRNYRLTADYVEYEGCTEEISGKRRMPLEKVAEIKPAQEKPKPRPEPEVARKTQPSKKEKRKKPDKEETKIFEKSSTPSEGACDLLFMADGETLRVSYFEVRQEGVFYTPCERPDSELIHLPPERVHEIQADDRVIPVHKMRSYHQYNRKGKKKNPELLRAFSIFLMVLGGLLLLFTWLYFETARSCASASCLATLGFQIFAGIGSSFIIGTALTIFGIILLVTANLMAKNLQKRYFLKKKP